MNEIAKLAIKLFIITAVAALALAFTNAMTEDIIAERIEFDNQQARSKVISPSDSFEEVDKQEILDIGESIGIENPEIVEEVFKDIVDGEIYGYTFKVLPKGYGGEIAMLVGISSEGAVTGVEVVTHSETPGLGSHITGDGFKGLFKDKPADEHLAVVKGEASGERDIEAISGATISSQAVVDGVNIAIDIFNEINK